MEVQLYKSTCVKQGQIYLAIFVTASAKLDDIMSTEITLTKTRSHLLEQKTGAKLKEEAKWPR
uniref:Uncharacterized protein n=1 Tax=Arundo donax TaxID=35708 RepID=A0A0A8YT74_ARUDO